MIHSTKPLTIKNSYAFTLIEIIVVVAIIGIISAVIIPRVSNSVDKANEAAIQATQKSLQTATELYKIEKGEYPSIVKDLVTNQYIDTLPDEEKLGVRFSIDTNGKITYEKITVN